MPGGGPLFEFLKVTAVEEVCEGKQSLGVIVKIKVAGDVVIVAGSAQDQVGAVFEGLRMALRPRHPAIDELRLTFWKVQYGGSTARLVLHFIRNGKSGFVRSTEPTLLRAVCAALQEIVEELYPQEQVPKETEFVTL